LRIVDNGIGFDPANAAGVSSGHFGIDGMKQRTRWLRGNFTITRRPEGGMEVFVQINWSAIPQDKPSSWDQADARQTR